MECSKKVFMLPKWDQIRGDGFQKKKKLELEGFIDSDGANNIDN